MYYKLEGEPEMKMAEPKLVIQSSDSETYEFTIQPYPSGASGVMEYYFEVRFDKQEIGRIPGKITINVVGDGSCARK